MKILSIQSSPNLEGSNTRSTSKELIDSLKRKYPAASVTIRDVTQEPIGHVSPGMLGALFTPEEKKSPEQKAMLAHSDRLVAELLAADVILVGAPMYNFSVPSTLKAYIDNIVRAGKTFHYTATGPVGLVPADKTVVLVTSAGGIYATGPAASMDHCDAYLRAIFGFLGIKKFHSIRVEGTAMGAESVQKAKSGATAAITQLTASL